MALRCLRRLLTGAGLASGLALGCFSDVGSSTGGTTGDSAGSATGECVTGSRGCPCYGNQTCDAGLICLDGIACFPPDCVAGTQACPCLSGGGCDVGLVCDGAQCAPAGTSESAGTSTMTTTAGDASDTAPTITDTSPTSGSTTGSDACEVLATDTDCDVCRKEECCDELQACLEKPDCDNMLDCAKPGQPFGTCAGMFGDGGVEFEALSACLFDAGADGGCRQCSPPTLRCAGDIIEVPIYRLCTECVAIGCCDELRACLEDPLCACMEACLSDPGIDNDYTMCAMGPCMGIDASEAVYNEFAMCSAAANCEDGAGGPCYPPPINPG